MADALREADVLCLEYDELRVEVDRLNNVIQTLGGLAQENKKLKEDNSKLKEENLLLFKQLQVSLSAVSRLQDGLGLLYSLTIISFVTDLTRIFREVVKMYWSRRTLP